MFPPSLLNLRILKPGRRVRLWLPLFLLWPLVPVLAAIALVCVVLVAIFTFRFGRLRRHLEAGVLTLQALCLLRELRVEVREEMREVRIAFY